jgi:hypothetical protein
MRRDRRPDAPGISMIIGYLNDLATPTGTLIPDD